MVVIPLATICGALVGACSDDDAPAELERIDGPAQVDPDFRQQGGGGDGGESGGDGEGG